MDTVEIDVGDLIEVVWDDTYHSPSILNPGDEVDPAWIRHTFGIVCREVDGHVIISPDYTPRLDQYDTYWAIPVGAIVGIKVIERKAFPQEGRL